MFLMQLINTSTDGDRYRCQPGVGQNLSITKIFNIAMDFNVIVVGYRRLCYLNQT